VNSIDFEGTAVQRGSIDYICLQSARSLPSGTLNIQSWSKFRRGYRLQSLQGIVRILPQTHMVFEVDAKAPSAQSRLTRWRLGWSINRRIFLARLARLTLSYWTDMATLAADCCRTRDQDFGRGPLSMAIRPAVFFGRTLSLSGSQALRLEIERLPIEYIPPFLS